MATTKVSSGAKDVKPGGLTHDFGYTPDATQSGAFDKNLSNTDIGALNSPAAPSLSTVAGTSPGTKVWVVTTYLNAKGESTVSPVASITPDATHQAQVASPSASSAAGGNATSYRVYAAGGATQPAASAFKLQNGAGTAIGTAFTIPGTLLTVTAAPVNNTSGNLILSIPTKTFSTTLPGGGTITLYKNMPKALPPAVRTQLLSQGLVT